MVPDGTVLNRYYDNKRTPRPESYREDIETASKAYGRTPSQVYLDLRAAAESGWDFSSRWMADGDKLATIHTTDLLPIDLNCLLYYLEMTIAEGYRLRLRKALSREYRDKAKKRAEAISTYFWSEKDGFFVDYDFVVSKRTPHLTLAGVYPLFVRVATNTQAKKVAAVLKKQFLQEGGLLTTLHDTGQQWDAPNGWAALHWVTIQGLRNYGYDELANEIKRRWIDANLFVYKAKGKLVEKYNVREPHNLAGGGEYVLQDGFGMTNGVLMALLREDEMGTI
jgi:alpha,alpha-trehalase